MNDIPDQVIIREYSGRDFEQLAAVYKSAFAEPPWNEYMKCSFCGINYGIEEINTSPRECKKCGNLLKLKEFWSCEDISSDLEFALSQESVISLVAENEKEIVGFAWGYCLPISEFPFLEDLVKPRANYLDDIAVKAGLRERGIGKLLVKRYLETAYSLPVDASEVVLRTDQNNVSSIGLFKATGFKNLGISDPQFPSRIYLKRTR